MHHGVSTFLHVSALLFLPSSLLFFYMGNTLATRGGVFVRTGIPVHIGSLPPCKRCLPAFSLPPSVHVYITHALHMRGTRDRTAVRHVAPAARPPRAYITTANSAHPAIALAPCAAQFKHPQCLAPSIRLPTRATCTPRRRLATTPHPAMRSRRSATQRGRTPPPHNPCTAGIPQCRAATHRRRRLRMALHQALALVVCTLLQTRRMSTRLCLWWPSMAQNQPTRAGPADTSHKWRRYATPRTARYQEL